MITIDGISYKELGISDVDTINIEEINDLLFQLTNQEYALSKKQFKEIIIQEGNIQFYAYISEPVPRVVGLLTLVVFYTPSGSHARIEDVVVDNAYRGRSIGRIITELALEKAKELKIAEVDLTSNPKRVAANQLYQKMGFEKRDTNVYRYKISD